jgi:hypothetical protein
MKKTSGISILVSTIIVAGLCGCASNSGQSSNSQSSPTAASTTTTTTTTTTTQPPPKPKKDKRPIEDRLTVGMSMDEVRQACGNPKNESMNSDGSAVWMFNNSQNMFIPYYGMSGGKIHYVTVIFDANGKVKSWSSSSTGQY